MAIERNEERGRDGGRKEGDISPLGRGGFGSCMYRARKREEERAQLVK